jgi:cell wall-associated NlpC family hydrolase
LLGGIRRNIRAWHLVAVAALAAASWAMAVGPRNSVHVATAGDSTADASLPPLPWQGAAPAEAPAAAEPSTPAAKEAKAPVDPKTGLPAASAGTNGSFTPPSPEERRRVYTATHPPGGPNAVARTALLIDRTALAPPNAPDPIKGAISAANLIVGQPYRLGGGHGSWRSAGYDCSGAVSYALAGAGLLGAPATSGQLMSWGVPGRGQWLTIYANPGHVYAVIAGLRWDTVGDASGSGPRWHPLDAYPQGYVARHLPGL